MEQAIKKAIDGGYDTELGLFNLPNYSPVDKRLVYAVLREEPLFWQALTKSLSLGQDCGFEKCPVIGQHKSCWLKVWHRFIDHLAEGKDTESFFNNLFTK